MALRLRVLGETSLEVSGKRWVPERKTAALLAFVALEGSTNRSRLAGLLWPDSIEERARGNLRQLLRRLRNSAEQELLEVGDVIRLLPQVEVDVVELQTSAVTEPGTPGWGLTGELLAGHDYDDCPELLEWLTVQRERLASLRRELLENGIERLQAEGNHAGALRLAERLLELDPLSEDTCRRLMRLHYLLGDRAAALRAFARYREALRREFEIEPLPETVSLAAEIERESATLPDRVPHRELPLALERPPLLTGREAQWAAMERGWSRGKPLVLRGEPGMGKTRLMIDFAVSRGRYVRLGARPGDSGIPYSLFSRGWRDLLWTSPDLPLANWAKLELARLLPEIAASADSFPGYATGDDAASANDGDKARLLEAHAEVVRSAAATGYEAVVVDDLHYIDAASFEALCYLLETSEVAGSGRLGWLMAYRTGELEPSQERRLSELFTSGGAVPIDLGPLTAAAIDELLAGLALPTPDDLAGPLSRYTGGNPLFIVETLKSLAETDGLGRPFPERLEPPRQLSAIIARRLERLSPPALRLARAVAILEDAFDLESAGAILEVDALDLTESLHELEGAQLVSGVGFSHDLVQEAVRAGIPAAARRLLHLRSALYLERLPVSPALIARHFLAAGDELRAAPFLKEAGDVAAASYRLVEAAESYRHAAELLERHGKRDAAFDTLSSLVQLLLKLDYGPGHGQVERMLFRLASSPAQVAVAWQTRSLFLQLLANADESVAAAREGHRHALASGDAGLQVELLNNVAGALWLQDRITETVAVVAEAIELGERSGDQVRLSEGLANMGVILDHLDRHREAIEYHRRAEALRARYAGRLAQVQVMGNLAVSQAELGRARDSLETARRMLTLLDEVHGANDLRVHALIAAGTALRDLGEIGEALAALETALELAERLQTWIVSPARRHLAMAYTTLGRFDAARTQLEIALASDVPDQFRSSDLQAMALVLHAQGEDTRDILAEADELLRTSNRPLRRGGLLIVKALTLPAEPALSAAGEALALARNHELGGLMIAAETRCAQASLALGLGREACAHAGRAVALLDEYDPVDFYLGEVHYTRYCSLAATNAPETVAELGRCLAWLASAADSLADAAEREGFLQDNPVNRALLKAADHANLDLPVTKFRRS